MSQQSVYIYIPKIHVLEVSPDSFTAIAIGSAERRSRISAFRALSQRVNSFRSVEAVVALHGRFKIYLLYARK